MVEDLHSLLTLNRKSNPTHLESLVVGKKLDQDERVSHETLVGVYVPVDTMLFFWFSRIVVKYPDLEPEPK